MTLHRLRIALLTRAVVALGAAVAVIVGCGGGVGVGGTGAYASGPITGFGSVIVSGIEFDDNAASVEDEDGVASSRAALRLGMVTEVDSGPIGGSAAAPTAVATRIRYGSELLGPVSAVDTTAASLVAFGQNVQVTATTVFDASLANGLASVVVGSTVEVYGLFDAATNGYIATRIEPRSSALFFKVRGPVQNLDTTAHTFTIGARTFSYASAAQVPAGLANGLIVRLRVAPTPAADPWTVLAFADGTRRLPDLDRAELRGAITAFRSSTDFSVNGQPVNASVAEFPDGTAGLGLGTQVEVRGPVLAGVLHATRVEIDDHGGPQGGFELRGAIETFTPAAQLFTLRGVTVLYGVGTVEFDGGSTANLAVGVNVEVRGVLSADGTRLLATRIKFD